MNIGWWLGLDVINFQPQLCKAIGEIGVVVALQPKQISAPEKGGGAHRVEQWIWTSNYYQVMKMEPIGIHSTIHHMDLKLLHLTTT